MIDQVLRSDAEQNKALFLKGSERDVEAITDLLASSHVALHGAMTGWAR